MINLRTYLLLSLAVFLSPQLNGQIDSSRALPTVKVLEHRDTILKLSDLKSSVPSYLLVDDKLQELGAVDAGDAVRVVPGAQLKDYGGIGGIKTVSFRSLSANHTQVVYDGNLVQDNQTGVVNLSAFDLLGVKSVAFSSGMPRFILLPATSFLAANTLQIVSMGDFLQDRPKVELYSNSTSIHAYDEGAQFVLPIKKIQIAGSGFVRFGSGEYDFIYPASGTNEIQHRIHSQMLDYRLRSNISYQLGSGRVSWQTQYRANKQELPGAVILYNPLNDQELENNDFKTTLNYRQSFQQWYVLMHAFYQRNETNYTDPTFLNAEGFIKTKYEQDFFGGGLMLSRKLKAQENQLYFGSDLQANSLSSGALAVIPYRFHTNAVLGLKYWLVEKSLLLQTHVAPQLIGDYYEQNDTLKKRNFNQLSPFVSLAWLPFKNEAFRIRTFYKRTFRLPTFNDLYYNFIGNMELDPETAHLFNLGLTFGQRIKKVHLELSADGYFNDIRNKIIAVPNKDLFNWSMQNIGRSQAMGLDVGLLIGIKQKKWIFTINSHHNFNQTMDVSDKESTVYKHQLPYTPFYSSSNSLSIEWKGVGINTNLMYTGYRYSLNENIYANLLDEFIDWNAGISCRLKIKNQHEALLHVKVMNLLNINYEVIRSYPMPGRYLQIMLRIRI